MRPWVVVTAIANYRYFWRIENAERSFTRGKEMNKVESVLQAARALSFSGIAYYNDHHTHEEVLALFDRAIELWERQTP